MTFLALVVLAAFVPSHQGDPWAQIWTELEALRAGTASPAETGALREHLVEATRVGADEPRRELLRASLEATAGHEVSLPARRLAALRPNPFSAREQWFLADLLPPGPERAGAVLAALESPTSLARWQFLLAWNTAADEARALRYEESTLPIQLNLHARYQAEWSALDLALTYKALGQQAAAERVISEAIAREEGAGRRPYALWEQRGVLAFAFGDERTSRDYLGRALALGSDEAGLLLARLDLMQGRAEAARRGFRALILNAPPPDWAWRGWGTTLLPQPFAAPITRTVPNE